MKKKAAIAVLYAALGNIIWGFSFLFTKTGLVVAPNPNVMLAHRFILSTLFMGIPLLLGKEKISFKGKNWKPVVMLLLMQSCYFLFETYGILYTNATIAGLVLAVVPVVTIGTGALFLREYPTRRQALFCILPVAGVIIMTVSGKELGVVTPLGIIFLLLTNTTADEDRSYLYPLIPFNGRALLSLIVRVRKNPGSGQSDHDPGGEYRGGVRKRPHNA